MPAHFFDTSGITKRYVNEIGTARVNGIVAPAARNPIYLVSITGAELVAAIARRQRGGTLTAVKAATVLKDFRYDFANQYRLVAVTRKLIASAMTLTEAHALRGYDAVQLAAALQVNARLLRRRGRPLTLVSADAELNAAARAEGLLVEDPNNHP